MTTIRRTFVVVCSMIALLANASVASAERVIHEDPNDTQGKLDVRFVGGTKNAPSSSLVVGTRTFARWDPSLLAADGDNRITFYFNINADAGPEYRGEVSFDAGALVMQLFGKDAPTRLLEVQRVDRRTITVGVPKRWPANPRGDVKVAVKTTLTGSGDCSDPCVDRAPDRGWLLVEAG